MSELLISINDESLPYPYRYVRVDIYGVTPEGESRAFQLVLDPDFEGEGTRFPFGGLTVDIYPFSWEQVQFVADRPPRDLAAVERWITHRLDIEDTGRWANGGLSGAIHSSSQFEHFDGLHLITVDFGTAPVEAVVEFIELLAEQGATQIALKTPRPGEGESN